MPHPFRILLDVVLYLLSHYPIMRLYQSVPDSKSAMDDNRKYGNTQFVEPTLSTAHLGVLVFLSKIVLL